MNLLEFTPRLRMFAGPNGSGKSTIKSVIRRELLGVYVNPDEIEAAKFTNRAYIFDNSGSELLLLAEITDAEQLEIKTDSVPLWFEKYVLGKMK